MKRIIFILSLLLPFTGAAKNKLDNCAWTGIKWKIGEETTKMGEYTDFTVTASVDYDLAFVSDYRANIGGYSSLASHWKKPLLCFLSRPKEGADLELWETLNKETNGAFEKEMEFENEHTNRIFGGWSADSIFLNNYPLDTFTYRHSAKFDSLFIVVKRADCSFVSMEIAYEKGLSFKPREKSSLPDGAHSIRGVWKFGNSYVVFDEAQTIPGGMDDIRYLKSLPVDSSQKGMMRMCKSVDNLKSTQGHCSLSMAYWIKDDRICFCDVKANLYEIPFKLSSDGTELYIVLTRSKLDKRQQELIEKEKLRHKF